MAVTISDIAQAAGVGRTTVVRALCDKGDISPETKERVKRIAAEMKYRPNTIARSLVLGHSNFVGIVATPSVISIFNSIVGPVERGLAESGYSMLFYTSGGDAESERLCLEQLIQNRVAGVVLLPSSSATGPEVYQDLVDAGIKVVIIDRYIEGLEVPQVVGDDYQSARLATEYLISLGHRDIVHLAIPRTCYAGRERARGFEDALRDAGLPADPSAIVETLFGAEYGAEAMSELLKRDKRPTAVLARQDVVAIGAMRAITEAGLSIPGDISLVGTGDIWFGDVLKTALTTVHHPLERMAEIGIHKLLDMLAGSEVPAEPTVLGVELVIRDSCAPPKQ